MQTTQNILLIRPRHFGYNAETAASNSFQNAGPENENSRQKAIAEFDRFAESLRAKGVSVFVFEDMDEPQKPDAVFPNNWVSFHPDGTVILYPMCAESRQAERRTDIIESLRDRFSIGRVIDLSNFEKDNRFLEGTGSIVFDHINKIAYACLSPRTDESLFAEVCQTLGYRSVSFRAVGQGNDEIYHTNVMMCVGDGFAVICLESIENADERAKVVETLNEAELEIIDITFAQMNSFAGNMLAVSGRDGKMFVVLSQSAFESLREEQISVLERFCELLPLSIPTIETIGGGSARCMMAEIFLPLLNRTPLLGELDSADK